MNDGRTVSDRQEGKTSAGRGRARRWEISENLHRADLTTLQRNEQIAEWIRLTEEQAADGISAQVAPKIGRGRPAAGINAASRELGIERTEAQRAIKIDGIAPAAKEAARAAGLENNQSALLKVAQAEPERPAFAFCATVIAARQPAA